MSSPATDPPEGAPVVHAAPDVAVPIRAGPLRLVFERGGLRWIRLGAREVLRGIHVALRDDAWRTVPARLEDLEIAAEPESFRIRFLARHRAGPVRFDWRGLIEAGPDGSIAFSMDGTAGAAFLRNRIGFCVLHPAEACAGRACIVEMVDGDRVSAAFPALVAPHQPFRNVRAILHEVTPGVEAEVRMEGDTFETEDQRNWSDASFKTYSTPLHLPRPVEVPEGARVAQSVTLRLFGLTAEPVRAAAATVPGALPKKRNSAEPVVVHVPHGGGPPRPTLGLGAAERELDPADAALLKAIGLDHVRADLRPGSPGWEAGLERAVANARTLGVPLEVALFVPDEPRAALRDVAERAGALRSRVACWLLFRASDSTTGDGLAAAAHEALAGVDPGALFGGGTDGHFVQLNRQRPPHRGLARLSFALSPQVHAFDDATLFECLASLRPMADTVRALSRGGSVGISPVTLRPRDASRLEPDGPPATDDPRQASPLAAAWTLGLIAAAAEAGIASLTLFELTGPRGVAAGGSAFPVLHALGDVLALPGADVLPVRSRRPERVQALALQAGGRLRLFLANATGDAHGVRLEGLPGSARRAPLGQGPAGEEVGAELELAPHEIVRIDAPLAEG